MKKSLLLTAAALGVLAFLFLREGGAPRTQPEPAPLLLPVAQPQELPLAEVRADPDTRQELPAKETGPADVGPALGPALGPMVPVRILTALSYARDAERVPSIAFELYRARSGAVTGSSMSSAPVHPDDPPLLLGRTDENGMALVELPEGDLRRDGQARPRLRVRIVEPGYQQRFGHPTHKRPEDDSVDQLVVIAYPGSTARGRVVDATGTGLPADVRVREWIDARGITKLGGGAGSRQLMDGWFEIDLREDLEDAILIADADHAGTGSLTGIDLPLEAPPQDMEIVIGGEGRLRGRVSDADGNPAAGLELLVWFAEFDDEEGSFISPEPAFSIRRAEGGGQLWVTLETDADGRFDVTGLRHAPYVIRARTGQGRQRGYPILLTGEPVKADGDELALELSRPHLTVRLLDADGTEWTGDAATIRMQTYYEDRIEEWPTAPAIMVFDCPPVGEDEVVQGHALVGRVAGPSEAVFEVPDGARYLVGAMGGGFRGELRTVELPPGAGRVTVDLPCPPEPELGTLSIRVMAGGQELDGRSVREPEFDVYLEDLDNAAILLQREEYGEPAPFVLTLPAGRYRLVAEGRPFVDTHHGTLLTERQLGRTEQTIEVTAGQTREVLLELEDGARLQAFVEGDANEADRAACIEELPWLGEPDRADDLAAFSAKAKLFLLRPGRRPEKVLFTTEWTGTSAAGTHLDERWPLGQGQESQILPAGSFTLLARMPGGREATEVIELRAGEMTVAKLRF